MKHPARLTAAFAAAAAAGRRALIPYLTAGDPRPEWTVPAMRALAAAGADIIELGVPFSDPMADGPVIQRACARAIANGTDLGRVLEMAAEFRRGDEHTPLVLMGYLNPIVRFGEERFAAAAAAAGLDGVLLVDCPPEEEGALAAALTAHGINRIQLVAPTTTPDRRARLVAAASGFVYYVALKGITGAAHLDGASLAAPLAALRAQCALPVAVGFGVKDAAGARAVAAHADGVVIGSALVEALAAAGSVEEIERLIAAFIPPLAAALAVGQPAPAAGRMNG